MIKSIDVLLSKLAEKQISKHVVCPSASLVCSDLAHSLKTGIAVIDERSAGYIAAGMCDEAGEPVVIWCAENDSYRNLTSSLTEAYYRKLPILVVAVACQSNIDQSINPYDTIRYYAKKSKVDLSEIDEDIDIAINYLFADIKGPVYFSLDLNDTHSVYKSVAEQKKVIDVSVITKIIPSNVCLHLGLNITCECSHIKDVISRMGHCIQDGNLSMLFGSSIIARDQLHIGIFSSDEIDYDLNMFGNRHIGNNIVVISLIKHNKTSIIPKFAEMMAWECRHIGISEISSIKECLKIIEKPQFIEVQL